ncbi:GNAT family N-acetyltransferase [Gammaproteobacteria bacterium]|nr:GNAT family N-acetyltransferase [Gammaproteobacteria bacterium]
MSHPNLVIKPFRNSDPEFELLYELENTLESHVRDWGSVEMLKYEANLIPERCNAQCEFLEIDGEVVGYGYTGHDAGAFDPTLLDSNIAIPNDARYSDYAQTYLEHQISRARQVEEITTLRAWISKDTDFMRRLYTNNGFEISLVEYVSMISLDDFDVGRFAKFVRRFEDSSLKIFTLKELQQVDSGWEEKLFQLWHRIDLDVPSDVIEPDMDFEFWKASLFAPWFNAEDIYIVVDDHDWVALSSYDRSDVPTDTFSTDLTGVLPEYRRQGICTVLKLLALDDLKRKGCKKIFTENEEDNPMFQINLMLGFKKIGSEVGCKLSL